MSRLKDEVSSWMERGEEKNMGRKFEAIKKSGWIHLSKQFSTSVHVQKLIQYNLTLIAFYSLRLLLVLDKKNFYTFRFLPIKLNASSSVNWIFQL